MVTKLIDNCISAIDSATLILETQTGIKKIIDDIAKAIMDLFLCCRKGSLGPRYSFFDNPNPLKEEINGIKTELLLR